MNASINDTAIIEVLLERLNKQRLPHALSLKEKVDEGKVLNDFDLKFLAEAMEDLTKAKPYYDRNPEYQEISRKITAVYVDIVEKASENQKTLGSR